MSKKYKLIKEYPGSPKLGTVLTKDKYGQYIDDIISIYAADEIEGYLEFWQEVIEPSYEILELVYTNPNVRQDRTLCYKGDVCISMIDESGCKQSGNGIIKLSQFSNDDWKYVTILKVKRLIDGEIFTIGDFVRYSGKKCNYDKFPIHEFYIRSDKKLLVRSDKGEVTEYIEEIEHCMSNYCVVEKEYEIIKYYDGFNVYYKTTDYIWTTNLCYGYSESELINRDDILIYSVKRLSDGEVFTIGDKIDRNNRYYKNDTIKGFYNIGEKYIVVSISDEIDAGYCGKKGCNLSIVQHSKEPLFTTEDGVDLYEGDSFWAIRVESKSIPTEHKLRKGYNYENAKSQGVLWFSTGESALEYIRKNVVRYSEADMLSFGVDITTRFSSSIWQVDIFLDTWKNKNKKNE